VIWLVSTDILSGLSLTIKTSISSKNLAVWEPKNKNNHLDNSARKNTGIQNIQDVHIFNDVTEKGETKMLVSA
jgi:hypothetical protein